MKVLFINPPALNELLGNNPSIIESERGFNPPLGLLLLAGYLLDRNPSHSVTVIDAQVERLTYAQLEQRLKTLDFDVAGMTAMTFTMLDVKETARILKQVNPGCQVVLGGPHVNLFPQETIRMPDVDVLVLGEGEILFSHLLDHMDDPEKLREFKGLVFKDANGRIIHTGDPEIISEAVLNTLPFPARQLTPYRQYSSLLAKRTPVTTMFTSRGCPFRCSFCNRPHLGKTFRALRPERVVAEMKACLELGIHEFLIYDDTFTVRKDRVMEICRLIIREKLDIGFDIRARVDTLDDDMLDMLKKAGCRGIHYGIEAGTPKILKVLNKGIDLNQAKRIMDATKKRKMQTLAYFMIGAPTETRADIETTFDTAKWLNPDFVHLTILTPFPGTPLYLDGLSTGMIQRDYWKEFAENLNPDFKPPHWDEIFPRETLEQLIVDGYKRFYVRPLYIIKKLFSIRSFGELKRKAVAGLKVLVMKKRSHPKE
ncbi:MAG: B12-binding domain-containing radical SAM protein [Candidatus Omnitrophota bacterium]